MLYAHHYAGKVMAQSDTLSNEQTSEGSVKFLAILNWKYWI